MSDIVTLTDTHQILSLAASAAEDKGALAPVALDVHEIFPFADAFLLVSGSVERNVQAIADGVEDRLNEAGVRTVRREGREGGRWILLDFGDLIVHVFHAEDREFYQLERLWSDCPTIALDALSAEPASFRSAPDDGVE